VVAGERSFRNILFSYVEMEKRKMGENNEPVFIRHLLEITESFSESHAIIK